MGHNGGSSAPAHGADKVVSDKADSGSPLLPHWDYPMWVSKKKKGGLNWGNKGLSLSSRIPSTKMLLLLPPDSFCIFIFQI